MLGTDHPISWEEHPVDHVMATTTLSLTQRAAILGGNAARLLNIKDVWAVLRFAREGRRAPW